MNSNKFYILHNILQFKISTKQYKIQRSWEWMKISSKKLDDVAVIEDNKMSQKYISTTRKPLRLNHYWKIISDNTIVINDTNILRYAVRCCV